MHIKKEIHIEKDANNKSIELRLKSEDTRSNDPIVISRSYANLIYWTVFSLSLLFSHFNYLLRCCHCAVSLMIFIWRWKSACITSNAAMSLHHRRRYAPNKIYCMQPMLVLGARMLHDVNWAMRGLRSIIIISAFNFVFVTFLLCLLLHHRHRQSHKIVFIKTQFIRTKCHSTHQQLHIEWSHILHRNRI